MDATLFCAIGALLHIASSQASTGSVLADYNHQIYVSTVQGVSNESCWEGGQESPCRNLDLALRGAQRFVNSTAVILNEPGQYELLHGSALFDLVGFGLLGASENVTVRCGPTAGFVFVRSTGITIENVSLYSCGTVYSSTTYPLSDSEILAAIHFILCQNVTISSSQFVSPQAIGIAMVDTLGEVIVSNSNFTSSIYDGNTTLANTTCSSGVYIKLMDYHLSTVPTNGKYTFRECHFRETEGTFNDVRDDVILGGGMTVYFVNNSQENEVNIESCLFQGNVALKGAGILIKFEDTSESNVVRITSTEFVSNMGKEIPTIPGIHSSGAGVNIAFTSNNYPRNNTVLFQDCMFHNNSAYLGGGISVSGVSSTSTQNANSVEITNCSFQHNHGTYGAAIDLFGGSQGGSSSIIVTITDCVFSENGISDGKAFTLSFSIVNINGLEVLFEGRTSFEESKGTAVATKDSIVKLLENSILSFVTNMASNGGAIAFRGNGHMIVHSGTQLIFQRNVATEKGGAIYSDQFNEHFTLYSQQCFIRYYNSSIHPNNWNVMVFFSDNYAAGERNSIFVTSLVPCVWPSASPSTSEEDIDQTFCWENWNYHGGGNCSEEVTTSPAYFDQSSISLAVFPGRKTPLPLQTLDEYQDDLNDRTVYTPSLVNGPAAVDITSEYITDNSITLYGVSRTTANLSIQTLGPRRIQAEVNVEMLPCPPGFVLQNSVGDNNTFACVCGEGFGGEVICNEAAFISFMSLGDCMTYDEETDQVLLARCLYYLEYARKRLSVIPLPRDVAALDEAVCGPLNREGKLCSQCVDGYGIAALSYGFECVECSGTAAGRWSAFIAAKLLPVTILFLVLMLFHVGVNTAPANAFIFFSQVVTIPREVLVIQAALALFIENGAMADSVIVLPYSIWNLDFFRTVIPSFCVDHNLRALHILILEYVTAFYPLLFIGITYLCIKVYDRRFKPLMWVWKPFRNCSHSIKKRWNVTTSRSIIDAIAAFLLLSYSKIIVVSLSILTPANLRNDAGILESNQVLWYDGSVDFFRGEHLFYAVPAIIVLVIFAVLPPVVLLLYPFAFFQRFLSYCKLQSLTLTTFVEVFQGCFKDGTNCTPDRRYFAGIYFVFRLVVFSIFATVVDLRAVLLSLQFIFTVGAVSFAIFQPYKVSFYNKLDVIMFGILAMVFSTLYYLYSNFVRTLTISTPAFVIFHILLLLPMLYISAYVIYWFVNQKESWRQKLQYPWRKTRADCPSLKERQHSTAWSRSSGRYTRSEVFADHSVPDRILHPDEYVLYEDTHQQGRQVVIAQLSNDQPESPADQETIEQSPVCPLDDPRSYGTLQGQLSASTGFVFPNPQVVQLNEISESTA